MFVRHIQTKERGGSLMGKHEKKNHVRKNTRSSLKENDKRKGKAKMYRIISKERKRFYKK